MLGLGVMIEQLAGYEEDIKVVKSSVGKTIDSVKIKDDTLVLKFTDRTGLVLWDNGQTCCESRYMVCDDNLVEFENATFLGVEVQDGESLPNGGEDHEVQFLRIKTSLGDIVCSNHNEHNGYYGGFSISARAI
jgi:hypothetical protein